MKQKHVRSLIFTAIMTMMCLYPLQTHAQEETSSGGGTYFNWGMALLSTNSQLADDIARFGEYVLPSTAIAYGWEVQWFKKNKFGMGSYYNFLANEIEQLTYQSTYTHWAAGLRFFRYLKEWERSQLYAFGDLGFVFNRYSFTDNSQPDNVFITDSLFSFGVKGNGVKPTVWINQFALGLNAGIGYDLLVGRRTPLTVKAALISTPTFPAYKTHDYIRITNLKRYHNLGGMITLGIGLFD